MVHGIRVMLRLRADGVILLVCAAETNDGTIQAVAGINLNTWFSRMHGKFRPEIGSNTTAATVNSPLFPLALPSEPHKTKLWS